MLDNSVADPSETVGLLLNDGRQEPFLGRFTLYDKSVKDSMNGVWLTPPTNGVWLTPPTKGGSIGVASSSVKVDVEGDEGGDDKSLCVSPTRLKSCARVEDEIPCDRDGAGGDAAGLLG